MGVSSLAPRRLAGVGEEPVAPPSSSGVTTSAAAAFAFAPIAACRKDERGTPGWKKEVGPSSLGWCSRGSRPDAGIIYWIGNFRVWLLALAGVSPFLGGPEKR